MARPTRRPGIAPQGPHRREPGCSHLAGIPEQPRHLARPGRSFRPWTCRLEDRILLASLSLDVSPPNPTIADEIKIVASVSLPLPSAPQSIELSVDGERIAVSGGPSFLEVDYAASSLSRGKHHVEADYYEDSPSRTLVLSASRDFVVEPDSVATTTLLSIPVGLVYGQPAEFTAQVSGATPGGEGHGPSGTVQFFVGGAKYGDPARLIAGSASVSIASLSAGTATVTARYLPDGSSGFLTSGDSATFSVAPRILKIAPQGLDKVYDGTTAATVKLADDRLPGDSIGLAYDSVRFASKDAGPGDLVTVSGLRITGAHASDYVLADRSVTTIATIRPRLLTVEPKALDKPYDGARAAAVKLADDRLPGDSIGLAYDPEKFDGADAGERVVTISGLKIVGTNAGDYYLAATRVATTALITPATPLITLDASPSTAVAGQPVTLSARVESASNPLVVPSGLAQFFVDGRAYGRPVALAGGSASIIIVAPPSGRHTVAVAYLPDGPDFRGGSQDLPGGLNVVPEETWTNLSISTASARLGDSVTFTSTVAPVGSGLPTPSGSVQFRVDGEPYGTPIALDPYGVASLTTSALSLGAHVVSASYDGVPGRFEPSVSLGATVTSVNVIAGDGTANFGGDGGSAVHASLDDPTAVAVDASGNLFIADTNNNRIRMVTGGIITTVAGTGQSGFGGDGGSATSARLDHPSGVAVDASGDLFIADTGNNRIRMIRRDGTIETVAGTGAAGFVGDGGPATLAELDHPTGLSLDASGNLFIADTDNHSIRMIVPIAATSTLHAEAIAGASPAAYTIRTVAGTGQSGFGGDGQAATSARLDHPSGVAVDASGDLFIADTGNFRVREVRLIGTVSRIETIAEGNSSVEGGGVPTFQPGAVAVGSAGELLIADKLRDLILMDVRGAISVLVGGMIGGTRIDNPSGLAEGPGGSLFVANAGSNQVLGVTLPVANVTAEVVVRGAETAEIIPSGGLVLTAQLLPGDNSSIELLGTLSAVSTGSMSDGPEVSATSTALPNQSPTGGTEEMRLTGDVSDEPEGSSHEAAAPWALIFHLLGPASSLEESLRGLIDNSPEENEPAPVEAGPPVNGRPPLPATEQAVPAAGAEQAPTFGGRPAIDETTPASEPSTWSLSAAILAGTAFRVARPHPGPTRSRRTSRPCG